MSPAGVKAVVMTVGKDVVPRLVVTGLLRKKVSKDEFDFALMDWWQSLDWLKHYETEIEKNLQGTGKNVHLR